MSNEVGSGIYKITNVRNGKVYVGSAVKLRSRLSGHKRKLSRGIHENARLQNSWTKYGEDCFSFEVIEMVEVKEMLVIREQFHIDQLGAANKKTGFNICPVAGSRLGVTATQESRIKMSESGKKRPPISEETRRKLSESSKGRKLSTDAIEKRTAARQGKKWTEESRQRLSEARKGIKLADTHKKAIQLALASKSPEKKELLCQKKSEALRQMHAERSEEKQKAIGKKISEAGKGRSLSEETRRKIAATLKGRTLSPQHREKIRAGALAWRAEARNV